MQAGAQDKAGRFVVVCGARPFPRCHCSGKAIIPPRDKQDCLWLSLLSPQRLEPLTTGQPSAATGNCHLPLHPGIWVGWGRVGLGRAQLGPWATCEIKDSRHRGEGRGPSIPSSSGNGPRSSLQMAQGLSPLRPAIGQPACTWHCGSGCCQRSVSSSQLRRRGGAGTISYLEPGTLSLM